MARNYQSIFRKQSDRNAFKLQNNELSFSDGGMEMVGSTTQEGIVDNFLAHEQGVNGGNNGKAIEEIPYHNGNGHPTNGHTHLDILNPSIKRQIEDAILDKQIRKSRNKKIELEDAIELKDALQYIDTVVADELRFINSQQHQEKAKHNIILSSTKLQQKIASYVYKYFLAHGNIEDIKIFTAHYEKAIKTLISPIFGHITGVSVAPEKDIKWSLSHALALHFFHNAKKFKIEYLPEEKIKLLDMHNGVDFIVIDGVQERGEKKYVLVYLVDAKSASAPYGENIVPYFREWRDYKLEKQKPYRVVSDLVQAKLQRSDIEIIPVQLLVNVAFDDHFPQGVITKEHIDILNNNLWQCLNYHREFLRHHIEDRKNYHPLFTTEL